jgi:hypothetical protein
MSKMFYSIEEVASKLKMSQDEVRKLASSGQLQEFRDRDKLVFKREQVDLLAGGREESDAIPLADSGAPLGIDDSRSASGSGKLNADANEGSTKERSGISIFEPDEVDTSDANAQTQVTSSVGGLSSPVGDPGASGSGLLGLTRDADDSQLGSDLLKDVYADGGSPSTDRGGSADVDAGGPLFESAGVASDVAMGGAGMGAVAMVAAEPFDGPGSGLAGGLALGMVLVLLLALVVTLFGITGVVGSGLIAALAGSFMIVVGGAAVLVLILGGLGWFLGRKG